MFQRVYMIEPFHTLLHAIQQFQNGLTRLKQDYLRSLYIQDAELTRQHLQRKIRFNDEQYRQRVLLSLLHHGRVKQHGVIVVVDSSGNETTLFPSNINYSSLTSNNAVRTCSTAEEEEITNHHTHQQRKNDDNFNNNHNKLISLSPPNLQQQQQQQFLPNRTLSSIITRRRRSHEEHLRSISRDLQTTLPTVAAFLFIPVVGYSFLVLGMMFPRILLSRQFHTREQRRDFAMLEYGQRRRWFGRLKDDFWGGCMRKCPKLRLVSRYRSKEREDDHEIIMATEEDVKSMEHATDQDDDLQNVGIHDIIIPPFLDPLTYVEMDAAGPVFDRQSMRILYKLCHHIFTKGTYSIMDNQLLLQPTHLHSIALSNNLATTTLALPMTLAQMVMQMFVPSIYLERKLIALGEDIILDDIALIEEDQISTECMGLTDEEVLEACWIRGLPVGRFVTMINDSIGSSDYSSGKEDEVQIMRRVLKHHLQMMEDIMSCHSDSASLRPRRELVRDGTLLLLVLHLPAIRYSMRESKGQN